jgi:TRAP-type C4-dicarboxylate transport system permease small subunit
MSHGLPSSAPAEQNHLGWLGCVINAINRWIMRLGMLALLAAAAILTYSVFSRYFFKASSDWQDEAAIFCLVGATFLCGAYVQAKRGHIGIEALAGVLPPWVNRIRLLFIDIFSALFCIFFAWKSWTLWHEAWAEGQTTSSSWAPPLWIPYALMAAGISLLAVQIVLQIIAQIKLFKRC